MWHTTAIRFRTTPLHGNSGRISMGSNRLNTRGYSRLSLSNAVAVVNTLILITTYWPASTGLVFLQCDACGFSEKNLVSLLLSYHVPTGNHWIIALFLHLSFPWQSWLELNPILACVSTANFLDEVPSWLGTDTIRRVFACLTHEPLLEMEFKSRPQWCVTVDNYG